MVRDMASVKGDNSGRDPSDDEDVIEADYSVKDAPEV
jgi:hypothetical protein